MRYRITLAQRIYKEIKSELGDDAVVTGDGPEWYYVEVNEAGRLVVEARLPGRVRWDSRNVKMNWWAN